MNFTVSERLQQDFFTRHDVLQIAEELIGKSITTNFNGRRVQALIVETEAYNGTADKACHAFGGRRTARNETMYAQGGIAYIYLCYGIHHLFNFVTSAENDPKAVLLRGLIPVDGLDIVLARRNKEKFKSNIAIGPGAASQALGFHTQWNGISLTEHENLIIADVGIHHADLKIQKLPRIGVDYAGADALLPYRFVWEGFEQFILDANKAK
jgi:DNA-3-methyladenine glycosylase